MSLPSSDLVPADPAPLMVRLHETDSALSALCREIERRIADQNFDGSQAGCEIDVELVLEFASHPRMRASYARNPAVLIRPHGDERPLVLVNWPVFAQESAETQRAILAHEVAHGVRAALKRPVVSVVDEEFEADCLAVSWGFDAELLPARREDNGDEYVEALEKLIAARTAMDAWRMQYAAHLIVPKRRLT